jgi:ribosomal protein S18 acetylase RimI-like enzyme
MSGSQPTASVRRARPDEIPQLAGVLARAFEEDPLMRWLAKDDAERSIRIIDGFTGILRFHSRRLEETWTTSRLEGVALWRAPGRLGDRFLDQLRLLPSTIRMVGLERITEVSRALRVIEARHQRHVPGPHYYLLALGVDPAVQGHGIGGRLVQPVLEDCDDRGVTAYLETVGDPNRRFYERHGFDVVEALPFEPAGIQVLLMLRRPR